ncbi:MAG: Lrp/AsnC family transcriptional regulator [Dehalococcoidia bacterium]|jgi:DNA-binding Lrp family transcriptional regulator
MLSEILRILENDARTSTKQIAAMTGISTAEITKLIKQAQKDRVILKYKAVVNWDKVEDERVWALIDVKVTPQKDVGFDAIAERVYRFPQARSVYLASGEYDLAVLVVGKTEHEVADFVSQKLATIEGVQGTATHFILRRYKEDGEILEEKAEIKRQRVVL